VGTSYFEMKFQLERIALPCSYARFKIANYTDEVQFRRRS
jgi:hypothetical protein